MIPMKTGLISERRKNMLHKTYSFTEKIMQCLNRFWEEKKLHRKILNFFSALQPDQTIPKPWRVALFKGKSPVNAIIRCELDALHIADSEKKVTPKPGFQQGIFLAR